MSKKQISLFDDEINWRDEWQGMPEYNQTQILPFNEVIVRFKTKEDMELFYQTISQKAPSKLKSIWFPKGEKSKKVAEVYTDES
jgi:hypothetical protein